MVAEALMDELLARIVRERACYTCEILPDAPIRDPTVPFPIDHAIGAKHGGAARRSAAWSSPAFTTTATRGQTLPGSTR